jgi:hypothetical protein
MELGAPVFDAMNEADVREEVIAPLIKAMGYRTGTEHNVLRELSLTYSRVQLGREKANDPPLRGKADYVLEAGGRVRWIIEAKAPADPLDAAVEAQAWSYANHPEVRAIYFLVTNGRQFRLYVTNRGPDAAPVLEFAYEEIPQRLAAITNTLGPAAMLRDHPDIVIDDGEPLGPGLRSTLRISSGRLKVHRVEPAIAPIDQMTVSIVDGSASRRPDGGITVSYRTEVAVNVLQTMNEQIGLNIVDLVTDDDVLSTDPAHPTVFRAAREMLIPKGSPTIDINTWQHANAPVDFRVQVVIEARGHLAGQKFAGDFTSTMRMSFDMPGAGPKVLDFKNSGSFELTLV